MQQPPIDVHLIAASPATRPVQGAKSHEPVLGSGPAPLNFDALGPYSSARPAWLARLSTGR